MRLRTYLFIFVKICENHVSIYSCMYVSMCVCIEITILYVPYCILSYFLYPLGIYLCWSGYSFAWFWRLFGGGTWPFPWYGARNSAMAASGTPDDISGVYYRALRNWDDHCCATHAVESYLLIWAHVWRFLRGWKVHSFWDLRWHFFGEKRMRDHW